MTCKNPEKKKSYNKAYYLAHQARLKAYLKSYRLTHKEVLSAKRAVYYQAHKEEIKVIRKEYRQTLYHKAWRKKYYQTPKYKAKQKALNTAYRKKHIIECRARDKKYYKAHCEDIIAYMKVYRKSLKGKAIILANNIAYVSKLKFFQTLATVNALKNIRTQENQNEVING